MVGLRPVLDLPISAASGLVKAKEKFFLIADDENSLLIVKGRESKFVELFPGELPEEKKARKKQKPDLESLAIYKNHVFGFPSGSTNKRHHGVKMNISSEKVKHFSLHDFYHTLSKELKDLNIEGACFTNDDLWLFQRGNGAEGENAIIRLNKETFLEEVKDGMITSQSLENISRIDLGTLRTSRFGFTDACFFENSIYFLAVAEGADSTYEDGKFLGAKLGNLSLEGKITSVHELPIANKPEGIWVEDNRLYLVTDADNRSVLSKLFEGEL